MKILIVYATYSSGTQIAAQFLASVLKEQHNDVVIKTADQIEPDEFKLYDLVVLGSPSWKVSGEEGQPHQFFVSLIKKMQGVTLDGKKFAVFGLGHSAHYKDFCGAVNHLEEAIRKTKGALALESLKIDAFYFHQKENEERLLNWAKKLLSTQA